MNGASLLKEYDEYVTSLDIGDIGWVRLGTAWYSIQKINLWLLVVGVMGFSTKNEGRETERESKAQKADQDVLARISRKATKKRQKTNHVWPFAAIEQCNKQHPVPPG